MSRHRMVAMSDVTESPWEFVVSDDHPGDPEGAARGGLAARLRNVHFLRNGLMAIPSVLIAIALLGVARGSIANVIAGIALAEFPRVARFVRGIVLSLREEPYVSAAIACGSSPSRIMLRHILPNALDPIIVQATYIGASAIITEAILSFIGIGTPPIIPSWGNIMAEGRALWQVKPYIVFFPSIFLGGTVLAVNLLGDGLRDMLDPRAMKRQ